MEKRCSAIVGLTASILVAGCFSGDGSGEASKTRPAVALALQDAPLDGGGSSEAGKTRPREDRATTIARLYVAEYQATNGGWSSVEAKEIRAWFARQTADPAAPLRGLTALLKDSSVEVRKDAAHLLGYLHDAAARPALTDALRDNEARVRCAACTALGWITPGDAAEAVLARLRRADPSVRVRVAAAQALGRLAEADALTAFRLGLAGKDEGLRERCEDILERMGQLVLPLPEAVYEGVSPEEYRRWREEGRVERQAIKDGTIFFEVTKRVGVRGSPGAVCTLGYRRYWYRTKAGNGR
jgi:hypothetical protein